MTFRKSSFFLPCLFLMLALTRSLIQPSLRASSSSAGCTGVTAQTNATGIGAADPFSIAAGNATLLTVNALPETSQCEAERQSVKTGTDPDAINVDLSLPMPANIATMRSWPKPASIPDNKRIAPFETTLWVVNATLTQYKLDEDSDYCLIFEDDEGRTITTKIPCPCRVGPSSALAAPIANARRQFEARFTATNSFQTANIPAQIMGIGLFDFSSGQTGAAPNGIELHPVLDIRFNVNLHAPVIISASIKGKKLLVSGLNFDDGAKIYVDGEKQKTKNDDEQPALLLIAKKAGKKIGRGQTVNLQVKNSDAASSAEFVFTRLTEPPTQLSPLDGTIFNNFPRTTTLSWASLPGAVSYIVEIDCFHCCEKDKWCADVGSPPLSVRGITTTSYTFNYFGAQPGRWRVRAVGAGGQQSPKTDWWVFIYTV
jgi:hypothetical protein